LQTVAHCRDEHRRPLRPARLVDLVGLERVAECYPPDDRSQGAPVDVDLGPLGLGQHLMRPCLRTRRLNGEVLARRLDGSPVMVRTPVGKGLVYFLSDPIEQSDAEADRVLRRRLYQSVIADAGRRTGASIVPLALQPDDPRIHVFRQPTARGSVFVIGNNRPPDGTTDVTVQPGAFSVSLHTANGWPALLHIADNGRILACSAAGEVRVGGEPLTRGHGLHALLALDRADLRRSEAIVLAPFEPGDCVLSGRDGPWSVVIGDFRGGAWHTCESLTLAGAPVAVTLDADRATCLVLLCRPGQENRWTQALEKALTCPDQLPAE
jgi:hypothetical protein